MAIQRKVFEETMKKYKLAQNVISSYGNTLSFGFSTREGNRLLTNETFEILEKIDMCKNKEMEWGKLANELHTKIDNVDKSVAHIYAGFPQIFNSSANKELAQEVFNIMLLADGIISSNESDEWSAVSALMHIREISNDKYFLDKFLKRDLRDTKLTVPSPLKSVVSMILLPTIAKIPALSRYSPTYPFFTLPLTKSKETDNEIIQYLHENNAIAPQTYFLYREISDEKLASKIISDFEKAGQQDKVEKIISEFINNENLSEDFRDKLFDIGCDAENISVFTPHMVEKLCEQTWETIFDMNLNNKFCNETATDIEKVAYLMSIGVLGQLIRKDKLPETRQLDFINREISERYRISSTHRRIPYTIDKLLATNTKSEEVLRKMLKLKDKAILMCVYENPYCPDDLLTKYVINRIARVKKLPSGNSVKAVVDTVSKMTAKIKNHDKKYYNTYFDFLIKSDAMYDNIFKYNNIPEDVLLNILHSKDTNVTQELKDVSKLILSSRRLGINEYILRVLCDKKYAEEQNTSLCKLYNEDREELLKTVNFMENSDIKNTKLQHFTTYLQNEIKNMDMEEKYGMTQIVSDYKKMKYDFYNRIDFVLKNTDKILDISEKFSEEEIKKDAEKFLDER